MRCVRRLRGGAGGFASKMRGLAYQDANLHDTTHTFNFPTAVLYPEGAFAIREASRWCRAEAGGRRRALGSGSRATDECLVMCRLPDYPCEPPMCQLGRTASQHEAKRNAPLTPPPARL